MFDHKVSLNMLQMTKNIQHILSDQKEITL